MHVGKEVWHLSPLFLYLQVFNVLDEQPLKSICDLFQGRAVEEAYCFSPVVEIISILQWNVAAWIGLEIDA